MIGKLPAYLKTINEDKHVFIRLKIHEADYLSGNIKFYSVEGVSPSYIMTQKFMLKILII